MEVIKQQIIARAIQIQQIPAPTFSEQERAAYIQQCFREEGLLDVSMDELGNVFGRLPGTGAVERPLVVSAHSDTVFPADTDLSIRSEPEKIFGPGLGDNSLGVAGLFGLLWLLRAEQVVLPGDLWLVANVCEEGLGDLKGMRAVVARFGDRPLAYLVLEGMALGSIFHRGLGVERYRITVRTPGGHSWGDYGTPSAIHELAGLVARLVQLKLPRKPRTSLNVGIISGGTSINTIAAQASLELDLRSEEPQALQDLVAQVEQLVSEAQRPQVEFSREQIGQRPAGQISPQHPLVHLAQRALQAQGIPAHLAIGSTDANIPLSQNLPCICIGLAGGEGPHTLAEAIYPALLEKGMRQLLQVVQQAYHE
ncbi:MAG: M20/M25/M40 family metallo-hydrolase [Anaerolineales bacterium]|nr:M20/M25/M40 family metallo-hydrolase [Anaerolineales bacterium]